MMIKEAVVFRVKELCANYDMAINSLANEAGITPSTIYTMLNPKRKDIGVVTIKKICDGLNISIDEFFCSDVFKKLEQEIR